MSAAVWSEPPTRIGRCAECARLDEQETAAALTFDRSRLSDLTVLRRRHAHEHRADRLADEAREKAARASELTA